MKTNTKKKSLLAVATGLLPTAATLLVNGQPVKGGLLTLFAIALLLGYDHYNDLTKGTPQLPDGVDEELFKKLADIGADGLKDLAEQYKQKQSK